VKREENISGYLTCELVMWPGHLEKHRRIVKLGWSSHTQEGRRKVTH